MTTQEFEKYFKDNFHRTSSFLSGFVLMIVDFIGLFCCIGLAFLIVNLFNTSAINFRSFVYYGAYFPLILAVFYAAGLYPGIMISPSDEIKKISVCSFFCLVGIGVSIILEKKANTTSLFFNFGKIVEDYEKFGVCIALGIAIPFITIGLPALREIARHLFGHYKWWGVPAVIYQTEGSSKEVVSRLIKRKDLGYKPAIIISSTKTEQSEFEGIPIFNTSKELLEVIKKLNVKVAILCDYLGEKHSIMTSYRYTISVSKNQDFFSSTIQLRDIGGIIGLSSTHNLTKKRSLFAKRLVDLILILIFSPILLPVTLIISIGVKVSSPGPVFYGHKRVGKDGKVIKCWKFRSMYKNSQEMLEQILATDPKMKEEWEKDRKFVNDPRVTKFGKFLRKTSLDELPQLWNIFVGEMSFVGPRPVTQEELEKYGSNTDYILSVTPGLSGMWQISGRSDTGYEERINLDTYYIQNWSFWLDIWIIIKTVWVVIKGKGAY